MSPVFRHHHLARGNARQRRAEPVGGTFLQYHRAGRNVDGRNPHRAAQFRQRCQHIGPARLQQGFLGQRAGCHQPHDCTADQCLGRGRTLALGPRLGFVRGFDLFGNRHPAAGLDQPREIAFRRMHRHPAHRDRCALMFPPRGQRDVENLRGQPRILEEQFEEIAHSVEQQRIARLFPQRQVLRHHRGGPEDRGLIVQCGHPSRLAPRPVIRNVPSARFPPKRRDFGPIAGSAARLRRAAKDRSL